MCLAKFLKQPVVIESSNWLHRNIWGRLTFEYLWINIYSDIAVFYFTLLVLFMLRYCLLLLLKSSTPKWIKLLVLLMLNNGLKFETVPFLPPHWLSWGQGHSPRKFLCWNMGCSWIKFLKDRFFLCTFQWIMEYGDFSVKSKWILEISRWNWNIISMFQTAKLSLYIIASPPPRWFLDQDHGL